MPPVGKFMHTLALEIFEFFCPNLRQPEMGAKENPMYKHRTVKNA